MAFKVIDSNGELDNKQKEAIWDRQKDKIIGDVNITMLLESSSSKDDLQNM